MFNTFTKNKLIYMKSRFFMLLCAFCCVFGTKSHAQSSHFVASTRFGNEVQAYADLGGARLFIQKNALTYCLYDKNQVSENHHSGDFKPIKMHAYKTIFEGASSKCAILNEDELPFKYNFFLGNDPTQWQTSVGAYKRTVMKNLYPETDLMLYFDEATQQPKYDIILRPNANLNKIKIKYQGADKLYLSKEGDLVVQTSLSNVIEQKPYAYQTINGEKVAVACKYVLNNDVLSFNAEKYDKNLPLIIDPLLIFCTYSGSRADNWGLTATYDNNGFAYSGGAIFNVAYPNLTGAFDGTYNGLNPNDEDMLISKFSSDGRSLVYYTYLGGNNNGSSGVSSPNTVGLDNSLSLVVDYAGNLMILGKTVTSNYPTTPGAFNVAKNGGGANTFDIVLSKLSPNGSQLLASTYIGGNGSDGHNAFSTNYYSHDVNTLNYNYGDYSRGDIICDSLNNYYVAINTKSSNFPTTPGAFDRTFNGAQDGVVFKMNSSLNALVYSTYLGGSQNDAAYSIALDKQRNVYVAGGTQSTNFPTTVGAHAASYAGGVTDGFLVRLNSTGTTLLHGTFVGTGSYDQAYFVQLDYEGRPWVTGQTEGNFPTTPNTWNMPNGRQFICRYSPTLNQRTISTAFGSGRFSPDISPTAFLVDICNHIYVSGWGGSTSGSLSTLNLPTFGNPIKAGTDGSDFYLLVLDSNATVPIYATFFGGNRSLEHVDGGTSRFDRSGTVYQAVCAGCGGNSDLPTTPNAFSATNNASNCNLGLFKLDFQLVPANARFSVNPTTASGCAPFTVAFQNQSSPNAQYGWDFGDGTPLLNSYNVPPHVYRNVGTYYCKLLVYNCRGADTTTQIIRVFGKPTVSIAPTPAICPETNYTLQASGASTYVWSAGTNARIVSGGSTATPVIRIRTPAWFYVTATDTNGCSGLDSIFVRTKSPLYSFNLNDSTFNICVGESITLYPFLDFTKLATWSWLPLNGITNPNQVAQTVTPRNPTTYYIQGTTLDSCYVLDSLTITPRYDVFANAGLDKTICVNGSTTLTASGGLRYLWNTGDTTRSITVTPIDTTQYWVIAYRGLCESRADTINIFVNDIFVDFSFVPDSGYAPQIVRFTNNSLGGNAYFWDFGNGATTTDPNPAYRYTKTGRYKIKLFVTNAISGCIDSLEKYILIDTVTLNVPNIITVNEDNLNDRFEVFTLNMKTIHIEIYNRWGELIFVTNDLKYKWNATVDGKRVPNGTYVVKIDAIGKNDQPYKYVGTLSVTR